MNRLAPRGAPQIMRSQAPAAQEAKRPNGHKAQLALRRDIEQLRSEIERQQKLLEAKSRQVFELENRLLALSADRNGWRARFEQSSATLTELERMLELPVRHKSREERHRQLIATIKTLQGETLKARKDDAPRPLHAAFADADSVTQITC